MHWAVRHYFLDDSSHDAFGLQVLMGLAEMLGKLVKAVTHSIFIGLYSDFPLVAFQSGLDERDDPRFNRVWQTIPHGHDTGEVG